MFLKNHCLIRLTVTPNLPTFPLTNVFSQSTRLHYVLRFLSVAIVSVSLLSLTRFTVTLVSLTSVSLNPLAVLVSARLQITLFSFLHL